jgi:hypothetical protein
MNKILIILIFSILLGGCASYNRFIERFDDMVADELRRYPCVDLEGRCIDRIDDAIMRWL